MKTLKKLVAITTVISFLASCSTNEIDPSNADSQAVSKKENATAEAQGKVNIRIVTNKFTHSDSADDPAVLVKTSVIKPTKDGSFDTPDSYKILTEIQITHGAESDFKYITVKYGFPPNVKSHKIQRGESKTFNPRLGIGYVKTDKVWWNFTNN